MCNDRINDELSRLAMLDPLTGVFNRRTFDERAAVVIADAARELKPLSLLAVDIDHFKHVNDEFGHEGGDEALRLVVALMRETLAEGQILSRIGGEEFAVLLPGADEDDARVHRRAPAPASRMLADRRRRTRAVPSHLGRRRDARPRPRDAVDAAARRRPRALRRQARGPQSRRGKLGARRSAALITICALAGCFGRITRLATIDAPIRSATTPSATPIGIVQTPAISIFAPMKSSTDGEAVTQEMERARPRPRA